MLAQPYNYFEIDHEIIYTIILPFHWLKKGSCQLQAKVCAQILPRKSVRRLTNPLNMTITAFTGL